MAVAEFLASSGTGQRAGSSACSSATLRLPPPPTVPKVMRVSVDGPGATRLRTRDSLAVLQFCPICELLGHQPEPCSGQDMSRRSRFAPSVTA